jgi:hypothetical protein
MTGTTVTPISHRDRAVLRAVAAGRCRLSRELHDVLLVDGMCLANQFAGSRLASAGLIVPAAPEDDELRLTASGRALIEAVA